MGEKKKSTREEILEAARNEFLTHGFEGTRLHVISDQIGVTKAMIHYYFNTKKELFEHIYMQSVKKIFGDLDELLSRDLPLFKKIELLTEHCIQKSADYSRDLAFVITESNRKEDWLRPIFDKQINLNVASFEEELEEAASNYRVASVNVTDLLLNIFSLCYYPVMAQSIHESLLNKSTEKTEGIDLQKRKGLVLDTILNWLTA